MLVIFSVPVAGVGSAVILELTEDGVKVVGRLRRIVKDVDGARSRLSSVVFMFSLISLHAPGVASSLPCNSNSEVETDG